MVDLDFDELDKAVNSLGANTPVSENNTTDSNQSTVLNSSDAQQPSVDSTQNSIPSPSPRSTGQFMDVVHPSSDMRRSSITPPERGVNNQSTPNNTPSPSTQPTTDAPPAAIQTDSTQTEQVSSNSDENKVVEDATNQPQNQNEDADIEQISDEITKNLGQTDNEPLESPFISGTKVEKRPLGAFSNDLSPKTPEPSDKIVGNMNISDKVGTTTGDNEDPLPAELDTDLLKVESDNLVVTKNEIKAPDSPSEPASGETKIEGPTAIVQQYKEKPSTGDQNTGAIYDTDSYHKDLIKPIKKKFGWMWVIWILILVVVGASAGAAVYFFIKNP